jgi:hypothetical protein
MPSGSSAPPTFGAESELIVPTDHSAHTHPLAVREVKRILKLHLQQSGVPRS